MTTAVPTSRPSPPASPVILRPRALYEVVDGKVKLNLHAGQSRAWTSDKRFVMVIAGTQGGKTSFGPWWLNKEISLRGPGDYIAATSSFGLFKLKMLPEMRQVFEHVLGIGRYWSGDKIIELADPVTREFKAKRVDDPMWGRIILRSAAAEGGLESATAKGAWLDELGQDDFPVSAWEAVLRRIALNRGRVLGTTTPYNLGWLKRLIVDPWKKGASDIDVIQFPSTMNPLFTEEEFESARGKLPEWKFRMFYMGEFSKPAGMIYSDFVDAYREDGGHLVKPFPLPSTWARTLGVDPGAVHTAKIWLAHDPREDVYYLYRSSLEGDKSTPEHVKDAVDLANANGEYINAWYVGAKAEKQVRMDYSAAGAIPVYEPPVADVEAGIDRVIQLFKERRLFIFDDCLGVLDEIARYSRETDEMGDVLEEIRNKKTFHHLDALRYAAAGASKIGVLFA
jgi:hypothetical protein